VTLNGGAIRTVACSAATGFKMSAEALDAAITPRTRWLLLNSPSNPTGAGYGRHEIEPLLTVLRRHPRVLLLSDEIYEHIVYDTFEHISPAAIAPDLRDRILVVNGVSKAYAMTGWRIGWGAGPRELIAAMSAVQSQVTSCASSVGQAAATAALSGPQEEIALRRDAFKRRRDELVTTLNKIPGIHCRVPEGAFYVFPEFQGLIGRVSPDGRLLRSDSDVVDYFLSDAHVAVVPGSAFGMPGHFRISYAASDETLRLACERLSRAVRQLGDKSSLRGTS